MPKVCGGIPCCVLCKFELHCYVHSFEVQLPSSSVDCWRIKEGVSQTSSTCAYCICRDPRRQVKYRHTSHIAASQRFELQLVITPHSRLSCFPHTTPDFFTRCRCAAVIPPNLGTCTGFPLFLSLSLQASLCKYQEIMDRTDDKYEKGISDDKGSNAESRTEDISVLEVTQAEARSVLWKVYLQLH